MSMTFTKLFSSITESSVWSEPQSTRLVWISMLAKADRHGRVFGAVPGLARIANVSLEECQAALKTLLSPDAFSRTPDHKGIRIEKIDGGWRLLNYRKYRDIRDNENEKEQARIRKQRQREKKRLELLAMSRNGVTVTHCHDNADADAELDERARTAFIKNGTPYENERDEAQS